MGPVCQTLCIVPVPCHLSIFLSLSSCQLPPTFPTNFLFPLLFLYTTPLNIYTPHILLSAACLWVDRKAGPDLTPTYHHNFNQLMSGNRSWGSLYSHICAFSHFTIFPFFFLFPSLPLPLPCACYHCLPPSHLCLPHHCPHPTSSTLYMPSHFPFATPHHIPSFSIPFMPCTFHIFISTFIIRLFVV